MAFAAILFLPRLLGDGDIYWHIAAGRWMIENTAVLRIDPFSLTRAGHPWQTTGWIGDIVTAFAYIGAGWSGILILFGAAAAVAAGVLAWQLSRRLDALVLAAVLVAVFAGAWGALSARPYLLALPLFAVWLAGLAAARGRAPSLKLVVAMVLWANLHSSFALGLMLILPFALEAVWQDPRAWRGWAVFAGAAVVASLVTPYGVQNLVHALHLVEAPGAGVFAGAVAAAAAAALLVHVPAIKPFRIAALIWLGFLALDHGGDRILFAASVPLLIAEPLACLRRREEIRPRFHWRQAAAFVVLIGAVAGLRIALPAERGDDDSTPGAAFGRVPAAIVHAPVLNEPRFGGYLIFNDVRPFIDSRSALYGESFRQRYDRMMRPDGALLKAALARYHIRWTILAPDNPAVRIMDSMTGWRRLYSDRFAVVHIKNGD